MAKFDSQNYAKNVLRSAKYIAVGSIAGINPSLSSYIKETASSARDMYDFVNNFRYNRSFGETGDKILEEAKKQKRNILDDIRTGKFYNPEREREAKLEYLKSEGMSFDFDLDDDDDDKKPDPEDKTVNAVEKLNKTQQKLTSASTDQLIRSGRYNTNLSIKSTNRMFGVVNNSLAAINTSVLALHQSLAEPLNNHITNSTNFYKTATEELAKQTSYLENINKMLTEQYNEKKKARDKKGFKTPAWEEVFGYNGLPNFEKWFKIAGKRLKSSSTLGMFSDMLSPDMLDLIFGSGAISSPIAQLAVWGLSSALGNSSLGKSARRTEEILKGGFMNLAGSIAAKAKGKRDFSRDRYGKDSRGFLEKLSSLITAFDISPNIKKGLSTEYNRGPIEWDGEAKKALTEVIPTQLASILYALGGQGRIFNYKTGKWELPKEAMKGFKEDRKKAIIDSSSEFIDKSVEEYIDNYNKKLKIGQAEMSYRSRGTRDFKKDLETTIAVMTMRGVEPGGVSDRELSYILGELIKDGSITPTSKNSIKRVILNNRGQFTKAIMEGRAGYNKFMDRVGESSAGVLLNSSGLWGLDNERKKKNPKDLPSSILEVNDDKGHNVYWYLQNFYSSFKALEHYASLGGGRPDRRNRRRSGGSAAPAPTFEVPDARDLDSGIPAPIITDPLEKEKDKYRKRHQKKEKRKEERKEEKEKYEESKKFKNRTKEWIKRYEEREKLKEKEKKEAEEKEKRKGKKAKKPKLSESERYKLRGLSKEERENYYISEEVRKSLRGLSLEERRQKLKEIMEGVSETEENKYITAEWKNGEYVESSYKKTKPEKTEKKETAFVTKVVDKFNVMLEGIFFGDNANQALREKGLVGYIQELPEMIAEDFMKTINRYKDKLKKWFEDTRTKFLESRFGSNFRGGLVEGLSNIGQSIGDHAVKAYEGVVDWWGKAVGNTAAVGGNVVKSGMVSVSRGELIIPSEHNPFYTGRTDKWKQARTEAKNYKDWVKSGNSAGHEYFGSFLKGGKVGSKPKKKIKHINIIIEKGDSDEVIKNKIITKAQLKPNEQIVGVYDDLTIKIINTSTDNHTIRFAKLEGIKKQNKQRIFSIFTSLGPVPAEAETNNAASTTAESSESSNGGEESDKPKEKTLWDKVKEHYGKFKESKAGKKVSEGASKIKDSMDSALSNILGDKWGDTKEVAEESKKVIKATLPDAAAAGAIGAIIGGAMTGSGLGLLGGLVLGAGVHVITNSEAVSAKLFGTETDDGKMSGGLIPPGLATFLKKRLPGMAKSGAIGSVLGALGVAPGGLLGGFIVGAGIDWLAHQEKVQNFVSQALFGNEDVNGERHGGIIGSLKIRVVDPLAGFVKEKIIGGAEKFFKDNLITPLKKFLLPVRDWAKGFGKKMFTAIATPLKSAVVNFFNNLGEMFDKTIGRVISGPVKWITQRILGIGKGLVTLPGRILGSAGDALNRHNIKAGYSTATTMDRLKAMGDKAYATREYDERISKLESSGKTAKLIRAKNLAEEAFKYSATRRDKLSELDKSRRKLEDMTVASLEHGGMGNPDTIKKIRKMMRESTTTDKDGNVSTDYSKIIDALNAGEFKGMSKENAEKLVNRIKEESKSIKKSEETVNNWETERVKAFSSSALKAFGIVNPDGTINEEKAKALRFASSSDAARLQKAIDKQLNAAGSEKEKTKEEKLEKAKEENPLVDETNTLLAEGNSLQERMINIVSSIAEELGVDVPEGPASTPGKTTTGSESSSTASGGTEDEKSSSPGASSSTSSSGSSSTGDDSDKEEHADGETKTITTSDGVVIKQVWRGKGWENDLSDSNTRKYVEGKEEETKERRGFFKILTGGGLLASLKDLFGKGKDKEKKETLFDKLKSGALGLLTKAGGIITGLLGPAGPIVTTIATAMGPVITGLLANLPTVIGGALLGVGLSTFGKSTAGTGLDSGMRKGMDPEQRRQEVQKMGFLGKATLGMNAFENQMSGRDMTKYNKNDYVSEYASSRVKKAIVRNSIYSLGGHGALASTKLISKIPYVGKSASKLLNPVPTLKKVAFKAKQTAFVSRAAAKSNVLKSTASQKALGKILNKTDDIALALKDKILGVLRAVLTKIPGVSVSNLDEAAAGIAKGLSSAGSKLGPLLAKAGPILYAGNIIISVAEAMQDAGTMTILSIVDRPTLSQRFIAAVIAGINAAIPGIGNIIPNSAIFDVVYTVLHNGLGVSFDNLEEQRANAKAIVDEYNASNDTSYTIPDYIRNVLGIYTVGDRIGGAVKSGIGKVKEGFGAVKEKIGGAFKKREVGSAATAMGNTAALKKAALGSASSKDLKNSGVVGATIAGTEKYINDDKKSDGDNTKLSKAIPTLFSFVDPRKSMKQFDSTLNSLMSKEKGVGALLQNAMISIVGGVIGGIVKILRIPAYAIYKIYSIFKDPLGTVATWAKNTLGIGVKREDIDSAAEKLQTADNVIGHGTGIHVTQKGYNRPFGNSTIDENGCGPAAAATVLRAYGRNASIDDTASWAESRGYVAGSSRVGTRASYFSDIFGANGIKTAYTTSKNAIKKAIESKKPVVLMGQDATNTSKSRSPYGPGPHYVVATGAENGKVTIHDSELNRAAKYKENTILNKTKLAAITSVAGGSNAIKEDDGAIWNYLKSAGLTDAGAAGLMGNLYAESGIKFNIMENLLRKRLKENNLGDYTDESYTAAIDSGAIDKNRFLYPRYPQKNSEGKDFQYGYGLVQWTSPNRKSGLYDLAKSRGVSISDPATQLEYLIYELKNSYPSVYNTLTTSNNLQETSDIVLSKFESPKNWQSHSGLRKSYGQTYYDKFTKEPPTSSTFGSSGNITTAQVSFPTYELSDDQLKGIANIIQHEQSGVQARYAEASLMANLIDKSGDQDATVDRLLHALNQPKGKNWFADGQNRYQAGAQGVATIEPTALAAATDVFKLGKRTVPRYIDEHDCFSDIRNISTSNNERDRAAYVPHETIVHNKMGSTYKFYSFPDAKSDPFGYTSDELRTKWGEGHYDVDENGNVTGGVQNISLSGNNASIPGYSNANTSSGQGFNLSTLLSSAFSRAFEVVGSKLTGAAGSIFKLITGGFGSQDTLSTQSSGIGSSQSINTTIAGDNTPLYGGTAKNHPAGMGTPQSMVQIAQSQLGVVEGGGNNNGNITDYGKFTGMDGQPWCASFVSWVMDKTFNGDVAKASAALRGNNKVAAVDTFRSNFSRAGALTMDPQPGDVVIYKNNSSHTGIVETVNGKAITTIEGNTSGDNSYDRNGGVVARKSFTIGDNSSQSAHLTGFGRPDWSVGGSSGLPLYDFTGSGTTGSDIANRYINTYKTKSGSQDTWLTRKRDKNMLKNVVDSTTRLENESLNFYNRRSIAKAQDQLDQAWTDAQSKWSAVAAQEQLEKEALEAQQKWADRRALAAQMDQTERDSRVTLGKSSRSSSSAKSSGSSASSPSGSSAGGIDANSISTIIGYLQTIAENSKYEAVLPTIVELIGKLTNVTATINSNNTSISTQDTIDSVNGELSSIMSKLESIASSL